jgi:hypothetical protein
MSITFLSGDSIGVAAIPTRMAAILVVIALIILELILQISTSPEEGLIQ